MLLVNASAMQFEKWMFWGAFASRDVGNNDRLVRVIYFIPTHITKKTFLVYKVLLSLCLFLLSPNSSKKARQIFMKSTLGKSENKSKCSYS